MAIPPQQSVVFRDRRCAPGGSAANRRSRRRLLYVVFQPDFRRRSTPLRNTSAARPELLQYGIKNRLLRRHEAF
jgi:hypothetical protein